MYKRWGSIGTGQSGSIKDFQNKNFQFKSLNIQLQAEAVIWKKWMESSDQVSIE